MGSTDAAQAVQGRKPIWTAIDFSWDMSYRVTKINSFVNCTYAYSHFNYIYLRIYIKRPEIKTPRARQKRYSVTKTTEVEHSKTRTKNHIQDKNSALQCF